MAFTAMIGKELLELDYLSDEPGKTILSTYVPTSCDETASETATNEDDETSTDVENENKENLISSAAVDTSEFCYLLSSCSKRVIDNIQCDLGRNNFLDVRFFVPNVEDCQTFCRDTPGCRYF